MTTSYAGTLYNKGVNAVVVPVACNKLCMKDALTEKDEKNISNYLVVPNNFILSLSLSLSSRAGVTTLIFFHAYAREANRVQTSKQRTFRKFPLLFFVLVSELSKEQNKETLTTDFTVTDNCNSLIIFCFLSLISRAGSSNTLSACREGEGKRLGELLGCI